MTRVSPGCGARSNVWRTAHSACAGDARPGLDGRSSWAIRGGRFASNVSVKTDPSAAWKDLFQRMSKAETRCLLFLVETAFSPCCHLVNRFLLPRGTVANNSKLRRVEKLSSPIHAVDYFTFSKTTPIVHRTIPATFAVVISSLYQRKPMRAREIVVNDPAIIDAVLIFQPVR